MSMKINKSLVFKMLTMFEYTNPIVQNDLKEICHASFPWFNLRGKRFLITGANGMIATYMVYTLMYLKDIYKDIKVVALVRDRKKAEFLFKEFLNDSNFVLLVQDVCFPIEYMGKIDYVFHFAGNASPYYIQNDPVGIMKSNLIGTINILELARNKEVEKIIFASTREVYGKNEEVRLLTETSFGSVDCLDDRSCYPESKRAAETLCKSYFLQYGVNFNIVRIAHTYGPGMKLDNDGRIMSDLLSCVINKRNIILKSKGDALRSFCYVSDTIIGLLYILLFGGKSDAYNLSNEREEISINSLARLLLTLSATKNLEIQYEIPKKQNNLYCNYVRVGLDTSKLEMLGWKPQITLENGLKRIINIYCDNDK